VTKHISDVAQFRDENGHYHPDDLYNDPESWIDRARKAS
jgi:hypothetical protein